MNFTCALASFTYPVVKDKSRGKKTLSGKMKTQGAAVGLTTRRSHADLPLANPTPTLDVTHWAKPFKEQTNTTIRTVITLHTNC